MGVEGELARAGIAVTDTEIVIAPDVEMTGDCVVEGDLGVSNDTVIEGDLTILGNVVGSLAGKYYLTFWGFDADIAGSVYVIVPTGGDGNVTAIRVVATEGELGTATITLNVNGGSDSNALIEWTEAELGAIGNTEVTDTSLATNIAVVAGNYIKLTSDGVSTAGIFNGVIEITRT